MVLFQVRFVRSLTKGTVNIPLGPPCLAFAICRRRIDVSRLNNPQEFSSIGHTSVHEPFTTRPNVFTVFTILCSRFLSSAIKVAIFGKLETLRQVAKIDHAQGQIQCSNTCMLFPCQNLLPSFYFLSSRQFLCQFFQCTFIKGLFLKLVFWFLHGFTGHACRFNRLLLLLCFIHTRHYCNILIGENQKILKWTADAPVLENVYLLSDKQHTMQTSWNSSTISSQILS